MSPEQSTTSRKALGIVAFDARKETFRMPLFRPGTVVMRGTKRHTVNYVILRRGELWVQLNGQEAPVRADLLQAEPALFSRVRLPDPVPSIPKLPGPAKAARHFAAVNPASAPAARAVEPLSLDELIDKPRPAKPAPPAPAEPPEPQTPAEPVEPPVEPVAPVDPTDLSSPAEPLAPASDGVAEPPPLPAEVPSPAEAAASLV